MYNISSEKTCRPSIEIPEAVMKLELHFDKPPLLHNDDKKKRVMLKSLQQKFEKDLEVRNMKEKQVPELSQDTNRLQEIKNLIDEPVANDDEAFIQHFFVTHETFMPHGNMYYRVITKHERELKKFVNSNDGVVCKFGCTENRLVKWCAKCNDRERLRRKEKLQQMNNTRLSGPGDTESELSNSVTKLQISENVDDGIRNSGLSTINELSDYVSSLTIHDVVYEHVYAEGVGLTISDLMLIVYTYYLMVCILNVPLMIILLLSSICCHLSSKLLGNVHHFKFILIVYNSDCNAMVIHLCTSAIMFSLNKYLSNSYIDNM